MSGRYYWKDITERIKSLTIGKRSHLLSIRFVDGTHPEMIDEFIAGSNIKIYNQRNELVYSGAMLRFDKQHYAYKVVLTLGTTVKVGNRIISQTRTALEKGFKASFIPLFGNQRDKVTFEIARKGVIEDVVLRQNT